MLKPVVEQAYIMLRHDFKVCKCKSKPATVQENLAPAYAILYPVFAHPSATCFVKLVPAHFKRETIFS